MSDMARKEAPEVVSSLQKVGVEAADDAGWRWWRSRPAQAVAEQVGAPESHAHSQLLPEDK